MNRFITSIALFATCSFAHATDGVIEINTAKISAAGGFPYTISQPGSYRLTGNLTVADANTTAIIIATDGVSIDLNGFAIQGPTQCSWTTDLSFVPQVSCTGTGSGKGIDGGSHARLSIGNGTVKGMGSDAINFSGKNARVERVSAIENGGSGIITDYNAWLSGNQAINNGADGIRAIDAVIVNNVSAKNGARGIIAFGHCTVTGNHISENVGTGIQADGAIIGNTSSTNGGYGLDGSGGWSQNVLLNNHDGNLHAGSGGSIPANSNLCGWSPC